MLYDAYDSQREEAGELSVILCSNINSFGPPILNLPKSGF